MINESIHTKIKNLTKNIEDNQELLSDPQKILEFKKYVNIDEELFNNIDKFDYQSFSLLCEFGSIKALVNEKRYDNIYKQSRNSVLRNILKNWKLKYINENQLKNSSEENIFENFNWYNWYKDNWKINIFPINNIKFNTLQGLINQGHCEKSNKRIKTLNNKSKNSQLTETQFLEDNQIHNSLNIKELEYIRDKLYNELKKKDVDNKGVDIWDLVLDKNENDGFSKTCYNIFSLLSLLKDSTISITSPTTIINFNHSKVFLYNNSKITPTSEKNTGIISNFTYQLWYSLCQNKNSS